MCILHVFITTNILTLAELVEQVVETCRDCAPLRAQSVSDAVHPNVFALANAKQLPSDSALHATFKFQLCQCIKLNIST